MKTITLIIITVILAVIMLVLPIALYKVTDEGFSISLEGIIILEIMYIAGLFALYTLMKSIKFNRDIKKEDFTYKTSELCNTTDIDVLSDCEYWIKQENGCAGCRKKYKKIRR